MAFTILICATVFPRMAKRKTKRNAGRLEARRGFKIRKDPMVRLAEDGPLPDIHDCMGLTRAHGQPFLFAIARDARTIFASRNIDWRSVFETAMPADRQVDLRVIGGDGVTERTVAVEPMTAMHYVTIRFAQIVSCGDRLFSVIRHLAFCRDGG